MDKLRKKSGVYVGGRGFVPSARIWIDEKEVPEDDIPFFRFQYRYTDEYVPVSVKPVVMRSDVMVLECLVSERYRLPDRPCVVAISTDDETFKFRWQPEQVALPNAKHLVGAMSLEGRPLADVLHLEEWGECRAYTGPTDNIADSHWGAQRPEEAAPAGGEG